MTDGNRHLALVRFTMSGCFSFCFYYLIDPSVQNNNVCDSQWINMNIHPQITNLLWQRWCCYGELSLIFDIDKSLLLQTMAQNVDFLWAYVITSFRHPFMFVCYYGFVINSVSPPTVIVMAEITYMYL